MIGRCGDTAGDGEGVALIEDLVGWDLGGCSGWALDVHLERHALGKGVCKTVLGFMSLCYSYPLP